MQVNNPTPHHTISIYIENEFNNQYIARRASDILERTSHIPIVSNIARGAGYCSYYARLSEAIGTRAFVDNRPRLDRAAGDGSDIHKILGLAILNLFDSHQFNTETVMRSIDNALDILEEENLLDNNNDRLEQNRESTRIILHNFVNNLERFLTIINSSIYNIKPFVEQNLISYRLHMRGTPDLILEDQNNKKAVVIDWKTSREPPSEHEKAQVICYSLMEADRLGYNNKDEMISAITGKYNDSNINDVKILPVIIRPSTERARLMPHPVLSGQINNDYFLRFRTLIHNVCIEAEHLTLLKVNQRKYGREEDTTSFVPSLKREVNLLRLTPKQLGRGNPQRQDRWPCITQNGTPFCNISGPCRYYFGREYGEGNDYERAMWRLRFIVFKIMEEDLLIYKALSKLSDYYNKEMVLDNLRNGSSVEFHAHANNLAFRDDKLNRIRIYDFNQEINHTVNVGEYRVNVVTVDNNSLRESGIGNLIFKRSLRDFETEVNTMPRVINEGKPIFITLFDNNNPLLSINTFGRVDEVRIENDEIIYEIGLPTRILRFSQLVFIEYLYKYINNSKIIDNILLVECNVDLTTMELNSIDLLQRKLKEAIDESNIDNEEIEREIKITDEIIRETSIIDSNTFDSDSEGVLEWLGRIIGRGYR